MKTKKIASLLLAGLLALSVAACGQQPVTNNDQGSSSEVSTSESQSSTSSDAEAGQTGEKPTEPTGQLVIGSINQLENEFYDTSFSSAETNYNLYELLHGGAEAVAYTKEGEFQYNDTVVASHEETENETAPRPSPSPSRTAWSGAMAPPSPLRTTSSPCCWRAAMR